PKSGIRVLFAESDQRAPSAKYFAARKRTRGVQDKAAITGTPSARPGCTQRDVGGSLKIKRPSFAVALGLCLHRVFYLLDGQPHHFRMVNVQLNDSDVGMIFEGRGHAVFDVGAARRPPDLLAFRLRL